VCKIGQHSSAIGSKLLAAGFADVKRLAGGMTEWQGANLPVVK
jgi:rhodanese-related sulfurtransferase